jgi:methylamine---glutamate N-methyltransferase subunit B
MDPVSTDAVSTVTPLATVTAVTAVVTLNAAELSTREINQALRALPDGTNVIITEPRGRHNLAVGLTNNISITIDGNAGYFIGGLGDGPDITVNGFTGWGVGENLMSGNIRIKGSVSQSAAASAHGGTVVVEGDASLRAGISLKGGTLAIAGDAGNLTGFMAQAGTILIGGDAGEALGDSLYEATIYVAGRIASLGADARRTELTEDDVIAVKRLCDKASFDHIDRQNITKVTSARELYHFTTRRASSY